MITLRLAILMLVVPLSGLLVRGDDSKPAAAARERMVQGRWLIEAVQIEGQNRIEQFWSSVISISGNRFTISNFLHPSKQLQGSIRISEGDPSAVDLEIDELDLASLGQPFKIEAVTLKALVEFESDSQLKLAVDSNSPNVRPKNFDSKNSLYIIELRRAPDNFVAYPEVVKISVIDREGKPVPGADAASFTRRSVESAQQPATMTLSDPTKTDEAGVVTVAFDKLPRIIRHEKTRQIAFPRLTPPSLVSGEVMITLVPERKLIGSFTCRDREQDQPFGWTNVYLFSDDGTPMAMCDSKIGRFEFLVPPGKYSLNAYGREYNERSVRVSVSAEETDHTVPPIELSLSPLVKLRGKPAPEFVDVAGWYGTPTKLADLKGRYVLLDFWGYWCGPCVGDMPNLIELHENYSQKGLTIIGVHVDQKGEVDSAEKLEAKLVHVQKDLWKGKKLPFANALVSGKLVGEGDDRQAIGTPKVYGIDSFPTTILIDREGNIVGEFHPRDLEAAKTKIEKLLGK